MGEQSPPGASATPGADPPRPLALACRLQLMGTDVRTGGAEDDALRLRAGVAAAALVELGVRRRVTVDGSSPVVLDRHRTHDAVLDVALNDLAHPRRRGTVGSWIEEAEGLVAGAVHHELRRRGLLGRRGRPAGWLGAPRSRVERPFVVEDLRTRAARSSSGASAGPEEELLLALGCAAGLHRVLLPGAAPAEVTAHLAALHAREARAGTTGGVLPLAITAVVLGSRPGGWS